MSFDARIAAVDVATKFQESRVEVFQMVQEETEFAKTQARSGDSYSLPLVVGK